MQELDSNRLGKITQVYYELLVIGRKLIANGRLKPAANPAFFGQTIRDHFDLVADHNLDAELAHLTREIRQDRLLVFRYFNSKGRVWQRLDDGTDDQALIGFRHVGTNYTKRIP